jgi:4-hydroxy-tetrahydrodipicolinate reductase
MAATSAESLRVSVCGIFGRVGTTIANAVAREDDLTLVGGVDIINSDEGFTATNGQAIATDTDMSVSLSRTEADVIIDFTRADAARVNLRMALERGVHAVVGTTGMEISEVQELGELAAANNVGLVVAPNFALTAVLMMHVSKLIGKHMDYCDIVEYHHENKIDSPSGTALQSAIDIREARGSDFVSVTSEKETLAGTRGGVHGGINVHAVRMPGMVAHQQVVFGGLGQTLTIRQDSTSAESFVPGVLLSVRAISELQGLTYGLDALLGLD